MAGTVLFEPGNFCILAGQYGRKKRQRVPFQILPKEITVLAEGFPIPAEQEIDEQADPWREEKGQHPGQGGLRPPILQHEEETGADRVQRERGGQNRAQMVHVFFRVAGR